jgi:hypothetical protein
MPVLWSARGRTQGTGHGAHRSTRWRARTSHSPSGGASASRHPAAARAPTPSRLWHWRPCAGGARGRRGGALLSNTRPITRRRPRAQDPDGRLLARPGVVFLIVGSFLPEAPEAYVPPDLGAIGHRVDTGSGSRHAFEAKRVNVWTRYGCRSARIPTAYRRRTLCIRSILLRGSSLVALARFQFGAHSGRHNSSRREPRGRGASGGNCRMYCALLRSRAGSSSGTCQIDRLINEYTRTWQKSIIVRE